MRNLGFLAALLCAHAGTAHSQSATQELSIERFRLSFDQNGILGVESGEVPKHLHLDVSAWFGFEDDPLALFSEATGDRVGSLVSTRWAGSLLFSLGLWDRAQIGLSLPFVASQSEDELADVMQSGLSGAGFGDIRVAPKLMLFGGGVDSTSLALIPAFTIPSAGADDYRGNDGFSFQPELALSHRRERFRVGANLQFASAKKETLANLQVDDQLSLRLGGAVEVADGFELGLNYQIATLAKDPFDSSQSPVMELIGGPSYTINENFTVFGAGGFGLDNGYGTPDWRVLLGLRFHPSSSKAEPQATPEPVDTDGDGIFDPDDECPLEPETVNGEADDDGCPEAETVEEPKDSDSDGIFDEQDQCASEPEDFDQFEDKDGCPDPDNDGDTVLDVSDRCVMVLGPVDNEGCPYPDRDKDTVVDKFDNCPDEPGTVENQGCKNKQLVKVTHRSVEILERVFFKTNKAKILTKSYALLDNVAEVLKSHQEIGTIEVEGHTDSHGSDRSNRRLSQRRADSVVRYLVKKGVKKSRLKAIGYGEERPIETNETDEGRSTNRRVEFKISGDSDSGIDVKASGPSGE